MMTDSAFDAFVQQTSEELEAKQELLTETYGIGRHESYWLDQTTGKLQFKDAQGRPQTETTVTPIGSYSEASRTWQWAWANKSITESLRAKSERLKELYELTGFHVFQLPSIEADEAMAWELTAMAVSHLKSLGCYRLPTGHLHVFVAIDSAKRLDQQS